MANADVGDVSWSLRLRKKAVDQLICAYVSRSYVKVEKKSTARQAQETASVLGDWFLRTSVAESASVITVRYGTVRYRK